MSTQPNYTRPLDLRHGVVEMAHGAGGRAMQQLIAELFARHLGNEFLAQGNDGAVLPAPSSGEQLVISTDAHVITPLFFPGGDIGSLAIHGTINDVAVMGARPLYLAASFILEEGLALADLARIVESMARAATAAGVPIVTGDTKVVERGKADGVFITTTGVGALPAGLVLGGARARPGDAVLISGSIGDHGTAVMSQRESLRFDAPTESDSAALHELVAAMLATGADIRCLRDPTRGGVAATLNEIAHQSSVGIVVEEAAIPLKSTVAGACELLGLDPLNVANEGKLVAIVASSDAPQLLAAMRAHPLGRESARIGTVSADSRHFVQLHTRLGGRRMIDWLNGESLPRIC